MGRERILGAVPKVRTVGSGQGWEKRSISGY